MTKRLFTLLCATLVAGGLGISGAAAMPTLQWVAESGNGLATVGGHTIAEYNSASYDGTTGDTGDWTVTGSTATGGGNTGGGILWLLDGVSTASTTFSVASTAVSFMMTGDHNDGYADFLVDGNVVLGNFNLNQLGDMSLIVSGLSNTAHTIAVRHLDVHGTTPSQICLNLLNQNQPGGFNCPDHVAIYGGAALDVQSTVPEPATLGLVGLGLAGLGLATRRRRTA